MVDRKAVCEPSSRIVRMFKGWDTSITRSIVLVRGDCLKIMKKIPSRSIDLILCDLPYGTTKCKWDTVIPFGPLWLEYRRIIKAEGAIVLFGDEPFSSALRLSNAAWYKYDWYYRKSRPSGFVNAKLKPLKDIETISVFSGGTTANRSTRNMQYFPQGLKAVNKNWTRPQLYRGSKGVSPSRKSWKTSRVQKNSGYPRQVLDFANPNSSVHHPTEKPVLLLKYLIKTYTQPGHMVLDNTMGSGSTGVACKQTGRKFIGIEKDRTFYECAKRRLLGAESG